MSSLTRFLAKFAVETKFADLPQPIIQETKNLLMDSIGCALAGVTEDPGKMAISLAKRLGGTPESSIISTGDKVSCTNAVLANGQLINTPDYEARMPGGHAPAYIIPPALAMALGFEISARVYGGLRTVSPTGSGGQSFRWQDRQG